jgi:hypothetical protein
MDALEKLKKALDAERNFAEVAQLVGALAFNERSNDTMALLLQELNAVLANTTDTASCIKKIFKLVMGISVNIACVDHKKQTEFLHKSFFSMLDKQFSKYPAYIRFLILSELAYLDQSLATVKLRKILHKKISSPFKEFAESNAYLDYATAWALAEDIERSSPKTDKAEGIEVILVGSVKGGVGKTIAAIGLAKYLVEEMHASRVALVDLDPSGPTLQYNFHVPKVSEALGTNPKHRPKNRAGRPWSYPTFVDLFYPAPNAGTDRLATAKGLALNVARPPCGNEAKSRKAWSWLSRLSITPLPDSLTVTGLFVATRFFSTFDRAEILEGLDEVIGALPSPTAGGKTYVIVDLGPGLFGTNGTLFRHITSRYPTSLILLSSPRSFDVANSMYEGIWLSAPSRLRWQRSVLQLLNMWPPRKVRPWRSINDYMGKFIDDYFTAVLDDDFRSANHASTGVASAKYIMFWRLRSYVYQIAFDNVERSAASARTSQRQMKKLRYEIKKLPYDKSIWTLLQPTDLGAVALDVLSPSNLWYAGLRRVMNDWLKGGNAK